MHSGSCCSCHLLLRAADQAVPASAIDDDVDSATEPGMWTDEHALLAPVTVWAPNVADWEEADLWHQLDVGGIANENGDELVIFGSASLPI